MKMKLLKGFLRYKTQSSLHTWNTTWTSYALQVSWTFSRVVKS